MLTLSVRGKYESNQVTCNYINQQILISLMLKLLSGLKLHFDRNRMECSTKIYTHEKNESTNDKKKHQHNL